MLLIASYGISKKVAKYSTLNLSCLYGYAHAPGVQKSDLWYSVACGKLFLLVFLWQKIANGLNMNLVPNDKSMIHLFLKMLSV